MKYSVSILFRSDRDDDHEPLWEERILLIDALNGEEAEAKAAEIAQQGEQTVNTAEGATVNWRFQQVERTCLIEDTIEDGVELFSRFLRESEALSMLTPFDDG